VKKLLVAFFLLVAFGLGASFANERIVLLTTEYEPFCGTNGDTMWCDLVNAAFAREGIDVQWISYPQDREKSMVSDGTNVAFLSGTLVVTKEERPNFMINENPLIYLNVVAFFSKEKYPTGLNLKKVSDLKGKTVGAIRGTGSIAVLQNAGAILDVANDKGLLIDKLATGRYDIAVVGDLTGLDTLQERFPEKVGSYKYELAYSSPIDLIFSKKYPGSNEIKNKYDSGIAKIKADGTYMRIVEKYYPKGNINKNTLPKDLQ
jgi:polar amino acid transport system substrate-binding protein